MATRGDLTWPPVGTLPRPWTVADLIRMPVATLRYWRVLDSGPCGFIIGRRLRYWRQDVLDWLDEQRESTGRGAA